MLCHNIKYNKYCQFHNVNYNNRRSVGTASRVKSAKIVISCQGDDIAQNNHSFVLKPCAHKGSVRKSLSSLSSAAGKHLAAVCGRHSLSETMLLLSVELLGLISSQHE